MHLEPQKVLESAAADDNSFSFFLFFFFPSQTEFQQWGKWLLYGSRQKLFSEDCLLSEAWETQASKSQTIGLLT